MHLTHVRPERREWGEVSECLRGKIDPCELVGSSLAHDDKQGARVTERGPKDGLHVGQYLGVALATSVRGREGLPVFATGGSFWSSSRCLGKPSRYTNT
jgi:hypothetical protein